MTIEVAGVLLLVDVQRNMVEPPTAVRNAVAVAAAIAEVLRRARAARAVIIHVRNCGGPRDPDARGAPGWHLVHDVADGEHVVDKHAPDAFLDTPLATLVAPHAGVAVVGMQSEHCVRATSLAALSQGHSVALVRGAHATYDGKIPASTMASRVEQELAAAGVAVVDPSELSFEPTASPSETSGRRGVHGPV